MASSKPAVSLPYHHGNLRETLIAAAVEVVERQGPQAVSLRELAQAAGVSSAAPYRHFADRAAVLAAVAAEGYRDLLGRHAAAVQGRAAPLTKLKRAMQSFLAFTQARPGLFQLMYNAPADGAAADPAVQALEAQAHAELLRTLGAALPSLDPRALRLRMVTLWATLLGHALARQRHPLQPLMREGLSDAEIDQAVIDAAIGPL